MSLVKLMPDERNLIGQEELFISNKRNGICKSICKEIVQGIGIIEIELVAKLWPVIELESGLK